MSLSFSKRLSIGVDEAGRGCVIGPLVIATVIASPLDRRRFREWNVRDSKIVPARERKILAEKIARHCWFQVAIIPAKDVDAAVWNRTLNLNGLELKHMAHGLRAAGKRCADREHHAVVDAPSINARGFRDELFAACGWPDISHLEAKHRADALDRTVAAASILAKEERERQITLLKQKLDCDFGSGYPSDPKTRQHIAEVGAGATHVRWSWATCRVIRESQTNSSNPSLL